MTTISCVVHTFKLREIDDPEIYASDPIYQWQQTESGKWVMDNAVDIYWGRSMDPMGYQYEFSIVATFLEKDLIY